MQDVDPLRVECPSCGQPPGERWADKRRATTSPSVGLLTTPHPERVLAATADQDLPEGYRWATEEECEEITAGRPRHIVHIVVPRTVDSSGRPYTQGEADIAVPMETP